MMAVARAPVPPALVGTCFGASCLSASLRPFSRTSPTAPIFFETLPIKPDTLPRVLESFALTFSFALALPSMKLPLRSRNTSPSASSSSSSSSLSSFAVVTGEERRAGSEDKPGGVVEEEAVEVVVVVVVVVVEEEATEASAAVVGVVTVVVRGKAARCASPLASRRAPFGPMPLWPRCSARSCRACPLPIAAPNAAAPPSSTLF
jgi:hypothetical protein